MRGTVTATVAMLAGLVMLGTVVAQAQVQPSAPRPAPPAATATPEVQKDKQVEGTVSKVDPLGRTVGVSTGLFGLLGATVQVADDTQILVQGQPSKLTDIQQGDKVRASYEVRDGKNLARSIEVTQKKAQQRSSRASLSADPVVPPGEAASSGARGGGTQPLRALAFRGAGRESAEDASGLRPARRRLTRPAAPAPAAPPATAATRGLRLLLRGQRLRAVAVHLRQLDLLVGVVEEVRLAVLVVGLVDRRPRRCRLYLHPRRLALHRRRDLESRLALDRRGIVRERDRPGLAHDDLTDSAESRDEAGRSGRPLESPGLERVRQRVDADRAPGRRLDKPAHHRDQLVVGRGGLGRFRVRPRGVVRGCRPPSHASCPPAALATLGRVPRRLAGLDVPTVTGDGGGPPGPRPRRRRRRREPAALSAGGPVSVSTAVSAEPSLMRR